MNVYTLLNVVLIWERIWYFQRKVSICLDCQVSRNCIQQGKENLKSCLEHKKAVKTSSDGLILNQGNKKKRCSSLPSLVTREFLFLNYIYTAQSNGRRKTERP